MNLPAHRFARLPTGVVEAFDGYDATLSGLPCVLEAAELVGSFATGVVSVSALLNTFGPVWNQAVEAMTKASPRRAWFPTLSSLNKGREISRPRFRRASVESSPLDIEEPLEAFRTQDRLVVGTHDRYGTWRTIFSLKKASTNLVLAFFNVPRPWARFLQPSGAVPVE